MRDIDQDSGQALSKPSQLEIPPRPPPCQQHTRAAWMAALSDQSHLVFPRISVVCASFPYKCSHVKVKMVLRAIWPTLKMCGNDPFPCHQPLLIRLKLGRFGQSNSNTRRFLCARAHLQACRHSTMSLGLSVMRSSINNPYRPLAIPTPPSLA